MCIYHMHEKTRLTPPYLIIICCLGINFIKNLPESNSIDVVEEIEIVKNRSRNIANMYTVRFFFDMEMFYVQFVILFNYIKNVFMLR
jgi:hypothetical protein